jgi:cyclase
VIRPRIIPVLLLDSRRRLVKTLRFNEETYVGDPFNVIRIFNEKEVDEICVLDINCSIDGRQPDRGFVAELASECFMPLSYGGGINSVDDAAPIFAAGVEKVVLGRASAKPAAMRALASSFGSQAVAACIDCRRVDGGWRVAQDRGRALTQSDPVSAARAAEDAGVGEIIVQNIERDGARTGYDLDLIASVCGAVDVPVVALGGAGGLGHLGEGLSAGASAVASGSAFVFIGRLRAVLITYPMPKETSELLAAREGAA